MSKDKSSNAPQSVVKTDKGDRSSLVIGILTLIVIVGIFFALLAALSNVRRLGGKLAMSEDMRLQRGTACTFVYTPDKEIADGTQIVWYANGEEVDSYEFVSGSDPSISYVPQTCGQLNLQARIGDKYTPNAVFWVGAPRLTLTAPTLTMTYGEKPEIDFDCSGFVCDDCRENMDYDGCCRLTAQDGTVWNCCQDKPLPVGTYTVDWDKECCYKDYETEYVYGTVTVLPRPLSVNVSKQYDRTVEANNTQIELDGVCSGDVVKLEFDKAEFDSRNAGDNKQVTLQNARLCGKDSANYTLDNTKISGKITRKTLRLSGLTVLDKRYDGTTKAYIDRLGKLVGVADGDSVAIGKISAKFYDANVTDNKKVLLYGIELVGRDKDNYQIGIIDEVNASITK